MASLFWLTATTNSEGEELGAFEQKALRAIEVQPTVLETRSILGAERERAIQLIWDGLDRKRPFGQYSINDGLALRLLLKLEDHRAIQFVTNKMINEYDTWSFTGEEICAKAGQIQVVTYLAPLLYINEPSTYSSETTFEGPEKRRSIFATNAIANIIKNSDEIPESVREWARGCDLTSEELRGSARDKMRSWWKGNEAAIRAHDYAKLRPGTSFDKGDVVLPNFSNGPPIPGKSKEIVASTEHRENSIKSADKAVSSTERDTKQRAMNWFLVTAGIIVVLLAGAVGLLRATQKK